MARKICVALGEVGEYAVDKAKGLAGDIVYAGANDIIYFYHVDSCMAAAFYCKIPILDKHTLIGVHLAMFPPNSEWELGNTVSSANYYVKALEPYSVKNKITHAAFVGDVKDWASAAAGMCLQLNIPSALFVSKMTCDVWASPTGEVIAAAWPGHNRSAVPPAVGARFNVKNRTGYRGEELFIKAMKG